MWFLPEEMLQIIPIYSQQSWLSEGNGLVDSLQQGPKPHWIDEGSAIRQMMHFPLECIGTGHSPEALAFATSATKELLLSFLLLASRQGGGHPDHWTLFSAKYWKEILLRAVPYSPWLLT